MTSPRTIVAFGLTRLQIRTISDPDTDYVNTQDIGGAPLMVLKGPWSRGNYQQPLRVEAWVIFTDNAGVIKYGSGTFNFRALKLKDIPQTGFATTPTQALAGSVVSGGAGFTPILIPDVRSGDSVGVQLDTIANAPAGATKAVVYLDINPQTVPA